MKNDIQNQAQKIYHMLALLLSCIGIICVLLLAYMFNPKLFSSEDENYKPIAVVEDEERIENGIHVRTGLVDADGLMTVVNNCTNCHSAKLITQNRMNAERWNASIRWMQETQGLWDLGGNQEIIVNYLVENYPVKEVGRRENLSNIEWYELEN